MITKHDVHDFLQKMAVDVVGQDPNSLNGGSNSSPTQDAYGRPTAPVKYPTVDELVAKAMGLSQGYGPAGVVGK